MTPFGVYVHIPFCTVKCGYCDFNAYSGMDALKQSYATALSREVEAWACWLEARQVRSIAFGGGTPGEMPAASIGAVVAAIRRAWPVDTDAEVGLEANPGTSNQAQLAELADCGVNRISFGAQSFDPGELRFLDRIHSVEAIGASVANARRAGIENVGLDLIYGLPGQYPPGWRNTLERSVELGPAHVSCYALTVEEGTALAARVRRGEVCVPEPDLVADLYELATEVLGEAGYVQYELSNWCLPGHESRHNLLYWTDVPYLGVGAGAHGYLDGVRYANVAHPRAYLQAAGSGPTPGRALTAGGSIAAVRERDPAQEMTDFISLRLRLLEGLAFSDFRTRFGRELDEVAGPVVNDAVAAGVLSRTPTVLRLTRRGRLLHGEVTARLIAHVEHA